MKRTSFLFLLLALIPSVVRHVRAQDSTLTADADIAKVRGEGWDLGLNGLIGTLAFSAAMRADFVPGAPSPALKTYDADGRLPLKELYRAHEALAGQARWIMETVYTDQGLPIRVMRTKEKGPAIWILAGIHGEEPAPPDAVAENLDKIDALAAKGIPIVLFPLCNPVGYSILRTQVGNHANDVMFIGPKVKRTIAPFCIATHRALPLCEQPGKRYIAACKDAQISMHG